MATDDDADVLSPSERRIVELLGVLATEAVTTRGDLTATVVRRLRGQTDARAMLIVGSGVLAAVAAGLGGLLPAPHGHDERP